MSTLRPGPGAAAMAGQLLQHLPDHRDVVGGRTASRVARAQHHRQRFAAAICPVVHERAQRVKSASPFKRCASELLVAVRGHQRRIDVDDQPTLGAAVVVGGVAAGQLPRMGSSLGAGGVDGGQHRGRVLGERVDGARHRRIGGDTAVDARFGAQQRDVGQTIPPNASVTARSQITFAGSCTAFGRRHGTSAADNGRPRPVDRTASTNTTPPTSDTTCTPAVSTLKCG
jgi:hypothetical protein